MCTDSFLVVNGFLVEAGASVLSNWSEVIWSVEEVVGAVVVVVVVVVVVSALVVGVVTVDVDVDVVVVVWIRASVEGTKLDAAGSKTSGSVLGPPAICSMIA